MSYPRRGQIYLVHFDPTVGHEIQKTRPGLVVQNDVSNQYSQITIVAAVTSRVSVVPYPVEVVVEPTKANGLTRASSICLNQIRSVDRQGLVKLLGEVDAGTMSEVNDALRVS